MLPALPRPMKLRFAVPALVLLAACGSREATLSGTVAEGEGLTHVWVMGAPERSEIVGDSFSIAGIREDVVELRFSRGDREGGRMELRGIARGANLLLRGVSVNDGVAFPTTLDGEGNHVVEVNGVRLGTLASVPGRVDARGSLLSRSRSGDALLLRPESGGLPDLRVVVTPGTEIRTEDGEPISLERTDFGDTLRVVGTGESGFVIATLVEVRRSVARDRTTPASGGGASSGSPATQPVTPTSVRVSPAPVTTVQPEERAQPGEQGRARGRERGRGPPEGRGPGERPGIP